jgi:hypothetical protein
MTILTYHLVEHDGGWAYRADGTYSETFRTRDEAHRAAMRAAAEQEQPGRTARILYEDSAGEWHDVVSQGSDRPITRVDE